MHEEDQGQDLLGNQAAGDATICHEECQLEAENPKQQQETLDAQENSKHRPEEHHRSKQKCTCKNPVPKRHENVAEEDLPWKQDAVEDGQEDGDAHEPQ